MNAGDGHPRSKGRPAVFGEVLFDRFPDGSRVLGGAPFNVAWHLTGFGLDPIFISRVGADADGEEALERMRRWKMDLSGVQIDEKHATGAVRVTFENGQPAYEILEARAWDFIDGDIAAPRLGSHDPSLLCHGTLAARSDVSRASLRTLLKTGVPPFVDVNLRPPWWHRDLVDSVLREARWVKMNGDELRQFSEEPEISRAALDVRQRYEIEAVVITLGDDGACLVTADGMDRTERLEIEDLIDTVGAGDAFTAVIITGLIGGWSSHEFLERANRFAAEVCRRRGATHEDHGLYETTLEEWRARAG